jgi:hypothetical protein
MHLLVVGRTLAAGSCVLAARQLAAPTHMDAPASIARERDDVPKMPWRDATVTRHFLHCTCELYLYKRARLCAFASACFIGVQSACTSRTVYARQLKPSQRLHTSAVRRQSLKACSAPVANSDWQRTIIDRTAQLRRAAVSYRETEDSAALHIENVLKNAIHSRPCSHCVYLSV